MAPIHPYDVVVVGNVGIDTNVFVAAEPRGTETTFADVVDHIGHAGGYTSLGFARLGLRTAVIASVGDDAAGRPVREVLAGDGIDTSGLFTDPAGTARSVNLVAADGSRRNFYDGRGHLALRPDPAAASALLGTTRLALFHLPNWARDLLPVARAAGATIACDLQDVVSLDDSYRRDFVEQADILFFSAANQPDPRPLIEDLLALRPELVVVSGRGALGCAVGTAAGIRLLPPVPLDLPVVDTNGAGDGLAVGVLAGYVFDGRPLDEAVRRGQIAARWTCAQRACSSELITPEQLDGYDRSLAG